MNTLTILKLGLAYAGGLCAYLIGGFDLLLQTILVLTVLDFVTGVTTGVYTGSFSSRKCTRGIIRKVYIYLTIILANIMQNFTGDIIPIRETVIIFYIFSEGMSILENIGKVIEYPEKLKRIFEQLKEKEEAKIE